MIILNKEIGFGRTILHLDIAKLHTGTPIDLPVIIQRAKKQGPTVLLTAGIHGNEINGVEIVRQIIRKKYNVPAIGTIICIPVVNVFGFINQERAFPDGRDLNRMFPGSKQGSLAARFAYNIMKDIVPHVDYILDFHTGGDERFNYSQIRMDASDEESLELAKVFGTKFILNSENRSKSFRQAATDLGKKVLLFEGGKSLDLDRIVTQKAIQGTAKILRHLHMANKNMEDEINSAEIEDQYDLIISNPPFFTDTFKTKNEVRNQARFEDAMPFTELIKSVSKLLSSNGEFNVVIPFSEEFSFTKLAAKEDLYPSKILHIRGQESRPLKRSMICFTFKKQTAQTHELIIEIARHQYTKEYTLLTKDFYLKL